MISRFRCQQCDKEEEKCDCDKYCVFCQSSETVRLCADGLYYCKDCREACEYKAQDE